MDPDGAKEEDAAAGFRGGRMKVLTAMLLLGPLAGFAWMWSQCYLAQQDASRLREENVRLKQQVEYTTRVNHQITEAVARPAKSRASLRESLGPLFEPENPRDARTASITPR